MKIEMKERERGVEPPVLLLDVTEEGTGAWVLSAAFYFTDDYAYAIKAFADGDGYMAAQVPFHAWKNVLDEVIQIISEEIEEEMKAAEELGTFTDLVFCIEVNDKSLRHMAEKIIVTIQRKYPDLFQ
ncbi:MAG: hypothetical protein QXS63_05560 [Zestosphaera sp.]